MTQNEQGAAAPRISYCLSNLEPREVQFLVDMISTVSQPLVVTQPIYQKIVGQVQAQDKAREEAAKVKAGEGSTPTPSTTQANKPPTPKAAAPRNGKTK